MGFKLNPITGQLDIVSADKYVNTTGDTMTGDLIFPETGFLMTDSDTVQQRVTIGTDGVLTSTVEVAPEIVTGNPIGLLLSLTYTI